jgi:hypothetical protein
MFGFSFLLTLNKEMRGGYEKNTYGSNGYGERVLVYKS